MAGTVTLRRLEVMDVRRAARQLIDWLTVKVEEAQFLEREAELQARREELT